MSIRQLAAIQSKKRKAAAKLVARNPIARDIMEKLQQVTAERDRALRRLEIRQDAAADARRARVLVVVSAAVFLAGVALNLWWLMH